MLLSKGAVAGIAVAGVLLLLLVIILLIIVICLRRRLTSNNAANSHVERAPNTYEMSSGESSQPTYSTIYDQPEARAPATSTSTKPVVTNTAENDGTQPSAPSPQISSHTDTTLIDNDLYQ